MNYGYTVKCNLLKQPTPEAVMDVVLKMATFHRATIKEGYFEYDKADRPHVHGIMEARKGLFLSRFRVQGWSIHIDPLKTQVDHDIWKKYITKDLFKNQKECIKEIQDSEYPFV